MRPGHCFGQTPGTDEFAAGDYAATIAACTRALATNPAWADAYCIRARARRALDDLAGAADDASAALRLNPRHAWAHRTLGDIHLAQFRIKAALAACDEAIRLDPDFAHAYNTRAGARLLLGAFDAALSDCDRAIELLPHMWGFHLTRGNVRYHLFRADAWEDYRLSFRLNPAGHCQATMQMVAGQLEREHDEVFRNCAEHLRRDSGCVATRIRRGLALLLLGQPGDAQADFNHALAVNPRVSELIAMLYADVNRNCQILRTGGPASAGGNGTMSIGTRNV